VTGGKLAQPLKKDLVAPLRQGQALVELQTLDAGQPHTQGGQRVMRRRGRLARRLYASRDFRSWLGLVMFDEDMLRLYAARVCGSEILADRRAALLAAMGRHLIWGRARARRIAAQA
jgi:hypothetical protein